MARYTTFGSSQRDSKIAVIDFALARILKSLLMHMRNGVRTVLISLKECLLSQFSTADLRIRQTFREMRAVHCSWRVIASVSSRFITTRTKNDCCLPQKFARSSRAE